MNADNYFHFVGVAGLEPTTSCSQSMRATNCAIPRIAGLSLPSIVLIVAVCYRYTNISL